MTAATTTGRLADLARLFDLLALESQSTADCKEQLRRAAQIRLVAYLVRRGSMTQLHGQEWINAGRLTYANTVEARKETP